MGISPETLGQHSNNEEVIMKISDLPGFGSKAGRVFDYFFPKVGELERVVSEFGMISLEIPDTLTFTDADTYYPIPGTFSINPELISGFTLAADGKLTYTGKGRRVILGGTTDLSISGVGIAKVTYGLFKDDVLVPRAETPHDFDVVDSTENFSITGADIVSNGEVYQIKAKCSDAGRTISPSTLNVIFA